MLNNTPFNLENKVAIITGASKGIGKSISKKLSEYGCKIAMIGRNKMDLDIAKREIKSKQVMIFKCDVLDKKEFKNVTQKIFEKWGKIDILINNAGINRDKLLLRLSDEDWDDVININLKGIFNTTQIVSRYMLKNRYGKIINISSVIGQIGNSGQCNYAASKAGIDGMTRALAVEFGSKNINVNAIAPGFIKTQMTKKLDEKNQKQMLDNIPLNKLGSANDIANLACYLSSELSNYITGQIINVDGGMTIK
tara:strand:+ start:12471 stop:13226 length:756 start_codon:yes stop_codon:yes gene_type:complete